MPCNRSPPAYHPPPPLQPRPLLPPKNCSGRTIKSLKWFFIISCGLLLFIAAGLVAQGVVFFTSAGLFGTTFPYEVRHTSTGAGCVVVVRCAVGRVRGATGPRKPAQRGARAPRMLPQPRIPAHAVMTTWPAPPRPAPPRCAGPCLAQHHPLEHLGLLRHVQQRVLVPDPRAVWLHG